MRRNVAERLVSVVVVVSSHSSKPITPFLTYILFYFIFLHFFSVGHRISECARYTYDTTLSASVGCHSWYYFVYQGLHPIPILFLIWFSRVVLPVTLSKIDVFL